MSSMGKAMMGTGEAEGENRAMAATEMALNNPLIDEYSLKGAKGLLINITGGKDLTLFEVDQTVQKVRAEVDPEVELIFGAIKDENMEGKMRVSIVATALDGHKPQTNTVLNMVSRIHNRNNGYSEGLFPNNASIENNTLNSIEGATALKLDEKFEINEHQKQQSITNDLDGSILESKSEMNITEPQDTNSIPSGVSIENASYMDSSGDNSSPQLMEKEDSSFSAETNKIEEEHTPQLFENDHEPQTEDNLDEFSHAQTEKLFDQDSSEEEDFEIPAFLRKQKF